MSIFTIVILSILASLAASTDYCDPKVCTIPGNPTFPHIGCGASGQLGPQCPAGAENVPITDELKQLIVDTHNKLRQKIASGNQRGYKPAKQMTTMKWNDELAYLATLNALGCDFEHDQCRNTNDFIYAGQNLAIQGEYPNYPETKKAIVDAINGWYKEYEDATQNDIDRFPESTGGRKIGHFTQMVTAFATEVGCGITKYVKPNNGIV